MPHPADRRFIGIYGLGIEGFSLLNKTLVPYDPLYPPDVPYHFCPSAQSIDTVSKSSGALLEKLMTESSNTLSVTHARDRGVD